MNEHYKRLNIEPLDFAFDKGYNPYETKILKYIARYPYKNGKEDLKKVIYLVERASDLVREKEVLEFDDLLYFDNLIHFITANVDYLNKEQIKLLLFLASNNYERFNGYLDELVYNLKN